MSSFSPPPFSSSPPQMGGFSPPPMEIFSPPPMSSFSPPPINGFSPPPLEDSDDVIGDHFGLRRHSDMSDDNSFDLTGFSEKMKKIEIDKIKHLPPREILEIQRESLGEHNDIFVTMNGLELETEQKHKRLFINNQTQSCPRANHLNIDFDKTGTKKSIEGTDVPVNVDKEGPEITNENKNDHSAGNMYQREFGDIGNFSEPLYFGDFSGHESLSEPLIFGNFNQHEAFGIGDKCEQEVIGAGDLSEHQVVNKTTELDSLEEVDITSEPDDSSEHREYHIIDESDNIDNYQHKVADDIPVTPEDAAVETNENKFDCPLMARNNIVVFEENRVEDNSQCSPNIVNHIETDTNSELAGGQTDTNSDFDGDVILDCPNLKRKSFEADLERKIEFDSVSNESVLEREASVDFGAFRSFGKESYSDSSDYKGSNGFETNWRNVDSGESCDWAQTVNESLPELETKSAGIQFDSDDDEFGDFGDADNFGGLSESIPPLGSVPSHNSKTTYQSQIEFDDLVRKLLPKVSTVIINMYETVIVQPDLEYGNYIIGAEDDKEEACDNLVQDVLSDQVIWSRIEDPSAAPALDYTWLQSRTYTTLLNTLNIDTRNVLDGEGWKNSVPKFAANLMTPGLLQPLSADYGTSVSDTAKQTSKNKEQVQPAEFDWNNSGLINPLETDGLEKGQKCKAPATSSDSIAAISELSNQKSHPKYTETMQLPSSATITVSSVSSSAHDQSIPFKPAQDYRDVRTKERLSRDAAALLDSFPLLSFMSSPVLTFPVKSVERKGKRKL